SSNRSSRRRSVGPGSVSRSATGSFARSAASFALRVLPVKAPVSRSSFRRTTCERDIGCHSAWTCVPISRHATVGSFAGRGALRARSRPSEASMRTVVIGIVVVGALAGGVAFFLHGHEHGDNDHGGHEHSRGEAEKAGHSHANIQAHGGDVTMTQRHHFEVVFREASVRVYAYSQSQEPIAAKGLSGTAKLVKKGSDKP